LGHSQADGFAGGQLRRRLRAALRLLRVSLIALSAAAASPSTSAAADPQFCAEAQRQIGGVTVPVRNVVHRSYESFVKSKTGVAPLETQQFSDPPALPGGISARISCKMKTADHIREVHGRAAATAIEDRNACRELNRQTILSVWAQLPAAQRARVAVPPNRFLLHADENRIMGSGWVEPYSHVYAGENGVVHVRAKALLVEWDDWRWKLAPDRFRGAHYCHLITPEYTRALMLGELTAPELPPESAPPTG
jgi:hypothetical protein